MPKQKKKFILIDANALIHRAFHALPPLSTKKGEVVNAVYGFCLILLKVLEEIKPDYIACTFDRKEKTFRHKEFVDYKAKRVKTPDDLSLQFPRVKEVVSAMNIPIFERKGFEADDLIGTIAKTLDKRNDLDTIIVTGDKDTLQLIDKNTFVYTLRKGVKDTVIYDEKSTKEKFGIEPKEMIDFKALAGDPSDNIPGVAGIGEKTAISLITEYSSLENIYENLDRISESIRKKLEKDKKNAFLSKRLATIITNVPIDLDLEKCVLEDFDRDKVVKVFSELEFKSLLSRLPGKAKVEKGDQGMLFANHESRIKNQGASYEKSGVKYRLVNNQKDFADLISKLERVKGFALDTETDTLDAITGKLVGISLSFKENEAYFLDARALGLNTEKGFDIGLGKKLKKILEDSKKEKFGHNIKYDLMTLSHYGVWVSGISFDTMIASYLLNPGSRQHNLDSVSFSVLGYEMQNIEELIGKGKDQKLLSEVPIDKLSWYSCEDSDITLKVKNKLDKELKEISKEQKKGKTIYKVFQEMEIPLIPILAKMELAGIKIDSRYLGELSKEFDQMIGTLQAKIWKIAGKEFNVNSTRELQHILFEKLKLPTSDIQKIQTGFSTAQSELEKLREFSPIISLIEQYRELAKLKNTYVDSLPKLINSKTKRLHTSYNQAVTTTGRLSSSDPNLQNIPIRTDIGLKIRKAFISEKGYKLVSLDYSQVELRIAASVASDDKMIKAFKNHRDIHTETASWIFNKRPEEISKSERRVAKTINFGVLYGMGPFGLAQRLGISREEGSSFISNYFKNFPKIKKYTERIVDFARKHEYVETLTGRRRYFPDINSVQPALKHAAERMAVNMPLQGTAADIMKMAMIKIDKLLSDVNQKDVRTLLQVHDELVFEIKEDKIDKVVPEIKKEMESVLKLEVPLVVEANVGNNWVDMREK